MKLIHQIGLNVNKDKQRLFNEIGVALDLGIINFQIEEDDPRWVEVELLVKELNAVDIVTTKFSVEELVGAKYLGVFPAWHFGYPEPSEDFGYLNTTYDISEYCKKCGIGKKQIAPFRIKKAPGWGNKSILQLNWIFDEFFVKPDLWVTFFKPFGIDCRPVILDRTGFELDSIVQLVIPSNIDLRMGELSYEMCSTCGRKKYHPATRGFYPTPPITDLSVFRSSQYFGAGSSAHNFVIVSSNLYLRAKEAGLKGVEYKPCLNEEN